MPALLSTTGSGPGVVSPAVQAGRARVVGRSAEAARMFSDLMAAPPTRRRAVLAGLAPADLKQVLAVATREGGTPYALWRDDPVGFIQHVLGESMWSMPRQILAAVATERRVSVPSCFDSGKSWSSARAALWFAYTNPPGLAKVVTIAPLWRQVIRQLWPEIRRAHARAGLPGHVDTAQLKMVDDTGLETVVAYGLSAAPYNEAAVQGIHAPRLLLIVDEAGGISPIIGRNLRAALVGEGTHLLAVGNPPTDDESSWFEALCDLESVHTITISAWDTPNLTGERTPRCRSCPAEVPAHTVATHLVDREWVEDTLREHGEDSNYAQAKVFARFPKGGKSRALPSAWVDNAHEADEPDDLERFVALSALELPDETAEWMVEWGAWVRLGVDVAADGGDELVVARCVGDLVTIEHTSSGDVNANPVAVAGIVLQQIRRAEALAKRLGSRARVHVKVDGIGVGWGVAGLLQAWGEEGKHGARIVIVVVSESTNRAPDAATLKPWRKRDEMWLAGRSLLQPRQADGGSAVRLRVDKKTLAQMRAPMMSTNSGGHTVIESKKSLRERGLSSPDRAEAALLAPYEPASRRGVPASVIA